MLNCYLSVHGPPETEKTDTLSQLQLKPGRDVHYSNFSMSPYACNIHRLPNDKRSPVTGGFP